MASKEDDPAEWEQSKKELVSSFKEELKRRNRLMKDMVGIQHATNTLNMTESLELDLNLSQEPNSF
jgi:hypothetical protein